MMSGDKLLGGPQAGIIVGKKFAIDRLKKDPFARAMRVDKMTIAALSATLALYREPERALREIPTLAMITASSSEIRNRCERLQQILAESDIETEIVTTQSSVGAGAFPTHVLPSFGVAFSAHATTIEERLRKGMTPIIGRISDERAILDLRSVPPAFDDQLASAIARSLA
jgi:L-seryl-tRNA(Ser) seleniumtransferase